MKKRGSGQCKGGTLVNTVHTKAMKTEDSQMGIPDLTQWLLACQPLPAFGEKYHL